LRLNFCAALREIIILPNQGFDRLSQTTVVLCSLISLREIIVLPNQDFDKLSLTTVVLCSLISLREIKKGVDKLYQYVNPKVKS